MNDHTSLRISTYIPRTWGILLFRSTIIEIDSYDGVLLLNEHGDLYFLFHVQIIPFKTTFFKNLSEGKKRYIQKRTQSPLPRDANYDLENNDSRNVLRRRRFTSSDFSINYVRQCFICSRLFYLSGVFSIVTFKTLSFSYRKMYPEPMK